MRTLQLFLVSLLMWSSMCAQDKRVLLRWKVPANRPIAFEYILENVSSTMDSRSKSTMDLLFGTRSGDTCICLLKLLPNGGLAVALVANRISGDSTTLGNLGKLRAEAQLAFGRTQLRGEITTSGEITSFYMEQSQKNLLAMLCELPKDSVRVGDTWSLHTNLLWVKGAFHADTAIQENSVRLSGITEHDGDLLAELEYKLFEYVSGYNGLRSEKTHSGTSYGYQGTAVFNVTQGCWQSYECITTRENKYPVFIGTKQHSTVHPVHDIPSDVLESQD